MKPSELIRELAAKLHPENPEVTIDDVLAWLDVSQEDFSKLCSELGKLGPVLVKLFRAAGVRA